MNTQISSRGERTALASGADIAAPSGLGVALGVSSDQVAALIGVAISAALLPPITNTCVCLASALVYISIMLFFINRLILNLHHSANEQAKTQRLNKFYQMRARIAAESQGMGRMKAKAKAKAKKISTASTLKTRTMMDMGDSMGGLASNHS